MKGKVAASATLALALLLAGCGVADSESSSKEQGPKMNMQGAADRADAILDGTFTAIKPAVNWTHGESTAGSCDVSRRRAVMTAISSERKGNFLGLVERYWKGQGYKQLSVNPNPDTPAIHFQTPDEFNVRLLIGGNGQAFFEVATPCVEKSSVAPPKSKTAGPNYAGGKIPAPNVQSVFWSSTTATPPASPSAK